VFIYKGGKYAGKVIPPQQVTPYSVNPRTKRIGARLNIPDYRYGHRNVSMGFEHYIVCDETDMASVLYLQEEKI
jgi:hypothetical protein